MTSCQFNYAHSICTCQNLTNYTFQNSKTYFLQHIYVVLLIKRLLYKTVIHKMLTSNKNLNIFTKNLHNKRAIHYIHVFFTKLLNSYSTLKTSTHRKNTPISSFGSSFAYWGNIKMNKMIWHAY